MSTEKGEGKCSNTAVHDKENSTEQTTASSSIALAPQHQQQQQHHRDDDDRKQSATTTPQPNQPTESSLSHAGQQPSANPSTATTTAAVPSRPLIAISASKSPSTFFNLCRKFLITHEVIDLSALESAIATAVDTAHLLERSKLATIERVRTSYALVEPKKASATRPRTQHQQQQQRNPYYPQQQSAPPRDSKQRARITITVKRTQRYVEWLAENPHSPHAEQEDDSHHSPS